jgi:hypothetical protein
MIINKFTSSPFKLRRSIVPRNEGGAYETGGFDPDAYDSSPQIYAASIEGMSKTIGAAIGSLTRSDINKIDVANNKRRQKRISNIEDKIKKETTKLDSFGEKVEVGTKKGKKLEDRKSRIQNRVDKTSKRISDYESVYGKDSTSNDFLNKQRQE